MVGTLTYDTRWILVGDASRARLYEEPRHRDFRLVDSFSHEESRARVRDIVTDAQGRKHVGTAGGMSPAAPAGMGTGTTYLGRPGAGPETDPKVVEAQKFARELVDALERGLHDHAFERLVLVAPPQFLGLLKASLSAELEKRLEVTIDKDLAWLKPHELEQRLEALLV